MAFKTNAAAISIPDFKEGTIGARVEYFQEADKPLSLAQAQKNFTTSSIKTGSNQSISLGINVAPAWLKFTVLNNSSTLQKYRLSIETPWLDYIDTWLTSGKQVLKHIPGGDGYPFEQRPMAYRFYAFEHNFEPGQTEVYIRIETKGPMAIPIHFSAKEHAIKRDISAGYQYGLLYGIMAALALYNLVLYVFIKQQEYGLYSLYLIGFILNSLSYTGQLHTVITYDFGAYFQDWLDIFLMITYSIAGLHFTRTLLKTKEYALKLDGIVTKATILIPSGMLVGFVFNQLFFSMLLAFLLNTCFVILFIVMGFKAYYANRPFALIFLFSSVTAALCITVSTLAVAGIVVPYNDYTFKAIEVGMALEAILLSLILARQFRSAQLDKVIAEEYARTDSLTQINNRRGFHSQINPIWQNITRKKRDASIVLIDIDYFKKFNDNHGHNTGDKILTALATCITKACRKGDISARWGGEEFIIFLPETPQEQAKLQAERIRQEIETIELILDGNKLLITASLGVAGSHNGMFNHKNLAPDTLESMINHADKALYQAKKQGKNQVHVVNSRKAS
ncbi:sensor domain-containing diguanylate cyclase [Paraglaciecola aquimarina]|uniref:diguanylate cyclase n=1 Tax=Paraglaciecola algarum TaxID=3050085 RepID=A0ABS9D776_9ALTE|nr:sensor domain-containing diguanylate cyclase [Paraglaciecola sp. G1-23]